MEKARKIVAAMEYKQMVSSITSAESLSFNSTEEIADLRASSAQISGIVNILFSSVGCCVAFYWLSGHLTDVVGYVAM